MPYFRKIVLRGSIYRENSNGPAEYEDNLRNDLWQVIFYLITKVGFALGAYICVTIPGEVADGIFISTALV